MKLRKLQCLLLTGALLALALLPGCRLAREGENALVDAPTGDALCGVLVTDEYLDLMDMEAFLRDHPEAMAGGLVSQEDAAAYGGRIYAQVTEETLTSSNGETITHKNYTFPIEGARMLCVLRERDEDGVPNTLVINQGDMADVDTDADYTPDTEAISDGYFHESEYRSAPYFDLQIDGISLLDTAF